MRRYDVLGVTVDSANLEDAVRRVALMAASGSSHTVLYANPEVLVRASRDERFRETLRKAHFVFSDGTGLFWLGKLTGTPFCARISGLELMQRTCQWAAHAGRSVFLLGGKRGVAERAARTLRKRLPDLRIAGTRDGYEGLSSWRGDRDLREADIVFVGLGSPLQETWITKNRSSFGNARVVMAVGGAFDMLSGDLPRAPKFFRYLGLEWLWRLALEPKKRIGRAFDAAVVFPVKILRAALYKKGRPGHP